MRLQVKDFMNTPVATTLPGSDVGTVRDLMHLKGYSAIPIVEVEGEAVKIRGIITDHDMIGVYDDTVSVQQVMSTRVFVILPEASVKSAAEMMLRKEVHHLVVMEENKILGMVSSLDFVKLASKYDYSLDSIEV